MLYCGESNVAPSKYSIMDNKNHFESKVSDFLEALRKAGYSESTIRQYKKTCRLFIVYMDINYIQDCNVESIDLFLKTMPQEKTRLIHGTNYRLLLFVNYLTDRTIQKPVVRYVIRKFSGEIGGIMTKYLHLLEEQRLSPKTIDGYEHVFSYFLRHLSLRNVSRISDIGEDDVLTFISSSQNSKQRVLATMRAFCRYLYEQKLINKNIDYVIGRNRYIVKEKLPSTYTCEEVLQIESSVNQSTPVGKRDYAMLLLATRLGLRSSDIAGLQFSNLDWDRNIIRLIQYKTKREIELPLLKDVGEAIINYVKYGRPSSSSKQIFLSSLAPYNPVNGAVVSLSVRKIICHSRIDTRDRKKGPHAMRHTLASQLLRNGISLPVISETLKQQIYIKSRTIASRIAPASGKGSDRERPGRRTGPFGKSRTACLPFLDGFLVEDRHFERQGGGLRLPDLFDPLLHVLHAALAPARTGVVGQRPAGFHGLDGYGVAQRVRKHLGSRQDHAQVDVAVACGILRVRNSLA